MKQLITGGTGFPSGPVSPEIPLVTDVYNSLWGGFDWTNVRKDHTHVCPTAGTFSFFSIKLNQAPGGNPLWFYLDVGGVPSALVAKVGATDTTGCDIVNTVHVNAGDMISIFCDHPTGAITNATVYPAWSICFESDTAGESILLGHTYTDDVHTAGTALASAGHWQHGGFNLAPTVIPTAGKLKKFYVELDADPGAAGDGFDFTVYKNGIATALSFDIIEPATTGSDVANEVTVAAGDYCAIVITPILTPLIDLEASIGLVFVPDTDGEFIYAKTVAQPFATIVADNYSDISGHTAAWGDWETAEDLLNLGRGGIGTLTIKNMYFRANSVAPGAGKKWNLWLRSSALGGNTDLTLELANLATTANDTTHSYISSSAYDSLSVIATPTGSPSANSGYMSLSFVGTFSGSGGTTSINTDGAIARKMVLGGLI